MKTSLRIGKYLLAWGWIYFGVIRHYTGEDATAGLKLSKSIFYIGKRLA